MMRGGGEIEIDGERFPLDDGHVARVGAGDEAQALAGPGGIRVVVLGGVPGQGLRGAGDQQARRTGPDGGELGAIMDSRPAGIRLAGCSEAFRS